MVGISRRASACGAPALPQLLLSSTPANFSARHLSQMLPLDCYLRHVSSSLTPLQAAIVGAGDTAKPADVGGGQQRVFGERILEQPAAGRQHDLGVGPADHPVGMLDLDGMVKRIAED